MSSKIVPAILAFPGSNCERDIERVLRNSYGLAPKLVWYGEKNLPEDITHVILPGGFSFGDYLRAGALAAISPIMDAVRAFAHLGKPVMGICNGFQILCEAKLLPGMLTRNRNDRFVCARISMTWRGARRAHSAQSLELPIAHRDGRYFANLDTRDELIRREQIILTYDERDENGDAKVNGSMASIAGIVSGPKRNIIGLMPHPERMVGSCFGNAGALILDDFLYG